MPQGYRPDHLLGGHQPHFLLSTLSIAASFAVLGLAAQASSPLDACREAVAAAPQRYESYLCYFDQGSQTGRQDEAAEALDRLAALGHDRGWATLVRGAVANERREGTAAEREFYSRAAERLAASGEARGEVIAHSNLGRLLATDGDLAGVRRHVALARRAADASTDPEAQLRASVFEASQLVAGGDDLGRAYNILLKAQAAYPDAAPGLQMTVLRSLSVLSGELGLHEESVAQFERLLAMRLSSGNTASIPRLRFNLLTERRLLAERDPTPEHVEALRQEAEDTAASARALGDAVIVARAEALLAELWRREDPDRAVTHLERCERVARTVTAPTPTMTCLLGVAARDAARHPESADRALDQAADLAVRHGSDGWMATVADARVRVSWAGSSRPAAVEPSMRALDVLESLRHAQPEGEARMGFMRRRIGTYHWLAGRLLEGPEPDAARAFEVSERMRARVLEEQLAAGRAQQARAAPRSGQIAEVQKKLLSPGLPPAERTRLLDSLRLLELTERDADGGDLPFASPRPIALTEAQARLAPDDLLLLYLVDLDRDLVGDAAGGSWLLAISRDATTVHALPDRRALEAAVPMFVSIIGSRDGSEAPAGAALYRQLLAGALREHGERTRRLIVVPDGVLHALPFAALRERTDEPPLGARFAMTTAPSVSLWARWSRLPPQTERGVLVIADPDLPGQVTQASSERAGVLAQGLSLGPLVHARREGTRARRTAGRDGVMLAGRRATEAALKATDLRPFALIHLATHAVADDVFPDRSAVLLGAGTDAEDGLLQPPEIAALDLSGRAVVLSACQTAAGRYADGEGVLSLARAFFAAGARTVVAGLWRLRDDETERLMRGLYDGLGRGLTMGEALRVARAEAIADGAPAAAWAGVVVLGDAGFALPPAPFEWWRVAAVLAPLAIAAVVFGLAKRA